MRYLDGAPLLAFVFGLVAFAAPAGSEGQSAIAIFAGGCFWCMEPPFDKLDGVLSTTSGYIGGSKADATYKKTSSGDTGHREAVRIEYDAARVNYTLLLEVFWRNIDPHDARGQFCDKGPQYASAIFALTDEQRSLAAASKAKIESEGNLSDPIVTEILPVAPSTPPRTTHRTTTRRTRPGTNSTAGAAPRRSPQAGLG